VLDVSFYKFDACFDVFDVGFGKFVCIPDFFLFCFFFCLFTIPNFSATDEISETGFGAVLGSISMKSSAESESDEETTKYALKTPLFWV